MPDEYNHASDEEQFEERIIQNAYGNRFYTLDALKERTIMQFFGEMSGRSDLFDTLQSTQAKRNALREAANYVIATEYVTMTTAEKRWLLNEAYREVFRLGPLDAALEDESVTEISIRSWRDISIRRGFGVLEAYPHRFEEVGQFTQLLEYSLAPLGISFATERPFIEVGVEIDGRRLRLSLTGPPMMPSYTGVIRLHPSQPLRFEAMTGQVPLHAQALLKNIIKAGKGLLIVGDSGTGKTTLLANLLSHAPAASALVQRAAEVNPVYFPPELQDFTAIPIDDPVTTVFEQRIEKAVRNQPAYLFLDEVHGDEERMVWQALSSTNIPTIMTFRGRANTRRLHSAISMTLRRADRTLPQTEINHVLKSRLPFVAILSHHTAEGHAQLDMVAQWQALGDMLELTPLLQRGADGILHATETDPNFD